MGEQTVIVSGGSGLIGGALIASLRANGTRVIQLVRRPARGTDEIEWAPGRSRLDPQLLEGIKAVVNLNGASIGRLPWSRKYKRTLTHSRVAPTRTLATAIREFGAGAPSFISASAVGFYGSQPGITLDESSAQGATFLAKLCAVWEHEARQAGGDSRVVQLRTAPILHPAGVLKPMVRLTRFGLSGPLGRGTQIWPWVSLSDEVRAILHLIDSEIEGPVNITGPTPANANQIGKILAQILRRPYLLRAPAFALRLALGRDAAEGLLLSDARVLPKKLLMSGFEFEHNTPAQAIASAYSA